MSRRAAIAVLLAAAALPAAAQQQCDARANAPSMPTARFLDNGDGTVTDQVLKLMWMRCSDGQQWRGGRCVGSAATHGWAEAKRVADAVNRDGRAFFNDWRLPALRELATITERSCSNPRTNLAVFPDTPAAVYWSATPRPGEGEQERVLALGFGAEGVRVAAKDERHHVRLVRTGP